MGHCNAEENIFPMRSKVHCGSTLRVHDGTRSCVYETSLCGKTEPKETLKTDEGWLGSQTLQNGAAAY